MLRALSLSIGQLGDRAIVWVLAKSLLLSLAICAVLGWGGSLVLRQALARYDYATDSYFMVIQTIAVLLAIFFGFRLVAIPVIGFFADDVVVAVEARHYPQAALAATPLSWAGSIRLGAGSLLRLVGLNLLAFPLYVVLVFTAIGPILAFVAVNALLLGRDLGEMVAARHLGREEIGQWLRVTRGSRAVLGLIVTGLFMIPFVNLLAPVIGAAMATHLFHGRGG